MHIRLLIAAGSLMSLTQLAKAQHIPDWQNKDLKTDSLFGISTDKAYELIKGKKAVEVTVAVIDAGVDTLHEDLKSVLWVNPKKKTGDNGTYGWSYIGSAKGNVHYDNLELTRQVRQFQSMDTSRLAAGDLATYHEEKKDLEKQKKEADQMVKGMTNFINILNGILTRMGKTGPKLADFQAFEAKGAAETKVRQTLIGFLSYRDDFNAFKEEQLTIPLARFKEQADYQLNMSYDPRPVYVGDNYFNSKQHDYGSPDVMGPDATHGTHVSGIIAAIRNNGLGINGIADHVKIMAVRAVPDGDERDKDVANAIRYAADHGAKIINMSFGKAYSQDKKAVDEAVKYAMKKDVLLVQAAGNDDENIDSAAHYPNPDYLGGGKAGAYIVVGASGMKNDSALKAPFSNYGKTAVDVFAPGVQIYSSIPGSKYDYFDGTSMASPVVAGLAALIREYYPKLSAIQVKDIILKSVVKIDHNITLDGKQVPFSELCTTGGIVNAYQALLLAESYNHKS